MNFRTNRNGALPLTLLLGTAGIVVIAVGLYALYTMNSLTRDLRVLSSKLSALDKLEVVACDIHSLSKRMEVLESTNKKMGQMERYMSYVPKLAATGEGALAQARSTNAKIDITNSRLITTDAALTGTTNKLLEVADSLKGVGGEMKSVRQSIDKMATQFPALGEMRDLLAKANASIDMSTAGIAQVNSDFKDMKTLLQGMSTKFDVLPEMQATMQQACLTTSAVMEAMRPLGEGFPKLNSTMEEMNRTSLEMAKSMKKLPKQGAIGIGILTAAELFSH